VLIRHEETDVEALFNAVVNTSPSQQPRGTPVSLHTAAVRKTPPEPQTVPAAMESSAWPVVALRGLVRGGARRRAHRNRFAAENNELIRALHEEACELLGEDRIHRIQLLDHDTAKTTDRTSTGNKTLPRNHNPYNPSGGRFNVWEGGQVFDACEAAERGNGATVT
jgi:hypothetical protein